MQFSWEAQNFFSSKHEEFNDIVNLSQVNWRKLWKVRSTGRKWSKRQKCSATLESVSSKKKRCRIWKEQSREVFKLKVSSLKNEETQINLLSQNVLFFSNSLHGQVLISQTF